MNYSQPTVWRKKPVEIEAWQVTPSNMHAVAEWCGGEVKHVVIGSRGEGEPLHTQTTYLLIHTLEGDMAANWSDVVIKGVKGEFYPCRADIFFATYEEPSPS